MVAVKYFRGYKAVVIILLGVVAAWLSMCDSDRSRNVIVHPNGTAFAGSESCQTCHKDIYASHIKTAHYRTSQPADEQNVKGSFATGRNVFIMNDSVSAMMEKTDSGLYEVKLVHGKEEIRERIDITIGSGRKGQTFLYWSGNYLFQLPISYYTPGNEWCNSPGYPANKMLFTRNVPGECIECHGTFLKGEKDLLGRMAYDRESIVYGVDCERCHGPAGRHVEFQTSHPLDTIARYIINPAVLSRQQQLDNCALCHSGIRRDRSPSFSFVTGDKLEDYSGPMYVTDSSAPLDVHGNQYGLLRASKCFRNSKTMTCASCHDVHKDQANDLAGFSAKCLTCHNNNTAPFEPSVAHNRPEATRNCIDCHMPALPSNKIFVALAGKKEPAAAQIRTHLIARYSEQKLAQINQLIKHF